MNLSGGLSILAATQSIRISTESVVQAKTILVTAYSWVRPHLYVWAYRFYRLFMPRGGLRCLVQPRQSTSLCRQKVSVELSDGGDWMNKVVQKTGLWFDWMGDGVFVPPVGVSLIVSNGSLVERCHELALAIIRESLLKAGLKEATIFSRRREVKGRYLTFAQGVEGEGCFNRWSVRCFNRWSAFGKDVLNLCQESGFENRIDCCSLPYGETDFVCEVRRELGWLGPKMILLDLEFADLSILEALGKLAKRRKRRILVTAPFPFRTNKGNMTLAAVEVAAQTACGMSLDELAEAVVCIQSRKPNGVNTNAVVEVLKGQFFATQSKVEQESGRKQGLIAMARSLLNGFV